MYLKIGLGCCSNLGSHTDGLVDEDRVVTCWRRERMYREKTERQKGRQGKVQIEQKVQNKIEREKSH